MFSLKKKEEEDYLEKSGGSVFGNGNHGARQGTPVRAAGAGDQGPENSSTSQWVPYRPATTAAASSAASFSTL